VSKVSRRPRDYNRCDPSLIDNRCRRRKQKVAKPDIFRTGNSHIDCRYSVTKGTPNVQIVRAQMRNASRIIPGSKQMCGFKHHHPMVDIR
jgi:hypothetical protein